MGLYINIKKSKNLLEEENENISFDSLVNNNYVINKLKEMLFKLVPDLSNAGKKVINFCMKLTKFLYEKINEKDSEKLNEGLEITTISESFRVLYNIINNIFINEQSEMLILDKTTLDKSSIEINEFLKENIVKKNTVLININDIESINRICKFEEIKLFAIKDEENYICMPLDDKDFKGFKAISMMEYYHSYYNIPDDTYTQLIDLILDFSDFLKKNPNFKENKQYKFHDLTIEFEYHEDTDKITYEGYFSESEKKIVIAFTNFEKFTKSFSESVDTMIHEYIHYIDSVKNKNKFTNRDLKEFTNKIFKNYENLEEIDLKELQEELNVKDTSAFRYLIGLMQKHKYIDYVKMSDGKNNYTKIKMLIKSRLGSPIGSESYDDVNYYNEPAELNTHVSDLINNLLKKVNLNLNVDEIKEKFNELNSGFYISNNLNANNRFFPINLPDVFWEKLDKMIKNNPNINIDKMVNHDIMFINELNEMAKEDNLNNLHKKSKKEQVKEQFNFLKELKIFKTFKILDSYKDKLIKFFQDFDYDTYGENFIDDDYEANESKIKLTRVVWPFKFVKNFINDNFDQNKYKLYLQNLINFKNNNFAKLMLQSIKKDYFEHEIINSASEYADKQIQTYKKQLLGKNYTEEDVDKNREKINKLYIQIKQNYIQILNEKIDPILKEKTEPKLLQIIKDIKNKNQDNNKNSPNTEELQEKFLLRQYISLLIH